MVQLSRLLSFPDTVNETSARVVAAGVAAMAAVTIAADEPWILLPLTYGFAARAAHGPTFSPLGQLATRIITPRLHVEPRYVPGPPKRLAQVIGLGLSATSTVLCLALGRRRAGYGVLGVLLAAASLEAVFGICLACRLFPVLVRVGLVPESACEECADLRSRPGWPPEIAS